MERKALRQIKQTAGRRLPVVEFIPARRSKLPKPLDPDNETDRSRFVSTICERFNIKLGEEGLLP